MRHILNQAANAAIKAKGSVFEILYRRLAPRLGHFKAIWAVAHRMCRIIWKILHEGVNYEERGLLRQNAPHLVHELAHVVPSYQWWEGPFYGIGLKLYQMLSGKYGFGPSQLLSKEETLKRIPSVNPDGLTGGVVYYDGQFDDTRLLINLITTAAEPPPGVTVLGVKLHSAEIAGALEQDSATTPAKVEPTGNTLKL